MPKNQNEKRKIYFNRPQRDAFHIYANEEYHIWARRTGKDFGLVGPRSLDNMLLMPRSTGAFVFPTYRMGLSQILPNTTMVWEAFGYREGMDFLIGKKPPVKWRWPEPYFKPRYPEHTIYWCNGSCAQMISQDRPGTSNSYGLDWVIGNEVKFLDHDKLMEETIPAISGSYHTIKYFEKHPRFRSKLFCGDMPVMKKAQWVLKKSEDVDWDVIRLIKYYKKKQVRTINKREKRKIQKILDELRRGAIFYSEASTLDNIKVVGEKYIKDQQRALTPFKYRTQILNIRPDKIENGFYNLFDEKKHILPVNHDYQLLDKVGHNFEKINDINDCRLDKNIDANKPLVIAEDHNADINSLVICQPHYDINEIWWLKSMYLKMPHKFIDLIRKFAKYYAPLTRKEVIYYYDSTSIRRSELTKETNADIVKRVLRENGFKVTDVYLGNPDFHDVRFDKWERAFSGEGGLYPRYDKYNCHDLLIAIQQTGIRYNHSRAGWGKDKTMEHQHFETEHTQPHLTDAMDTAKRGCEERPKMIGGSYFTGNIYG